MITIQIKPIIYFSPFKDSKYLVSYLNIDNILWCYNINYKERTTEMSAITQNTIAGELTVRKINCILELDVNNPNFYNQ